MYFSIDVKNVKRVQKEKFEEVSRENFSNFIADDI